MGHGRRVSDVLAPLLPHVDEVVLTRCAHPKAMTPAELAAGLDDVDVLLSDGGVIDACLAEVYEDADEVIVTGSLFLVGAARSLVESGVLAHVETDADST
jgi:folylpolyglutamate synthase/dihydropteroate synthase